jgi:polyhydroxyalkanoate synthesis regulator phasin
MLCSQNKTTISNMQLKNGLIVAILVLFLPQLSYTQVLDAIDIHVNIKEKIAGEVKALPNAKLLISDVGEVNTDNQGSYDFIYPVRNAVDPAISISLLSENHKMLKPIDGTIELDPSRQEMYIDFLVVNMESESPEFKKRIAELEKRVAKLQSKNALTKQQLNALNSTLLDTILFFEANRKQLESQIASLEDLTEEQKAEISTLHNQVQILEGQVDNLTIELEQALEERYLRQNQYFKDVSACLLNYLRKTKDLRDHLPFIKSYFNSPGGFQSFDEDIRAYNKIYEEFDGNHLSYLEGIERYWENPKIGGEIEEVFDFLSKGIHQAQVLNVMRDINGQLHKQNPGKAQKIASLAYEDLSVNVQALEKKINRALTQLRKNI